MVRKRQFLGTFRYICLVRLSTSLQTYWCQSAYNTDTPNFPRALSFHAAWGNFRIPLGGYKDTHTHWALFRSLSPFRGPPNPSLNILEIHKSGRLLVQSAHLYGKLVPAGCPCSRQTYTGKFVPAALNTRHVRKYHEFPEFVHDSEIGFPESLALWNDHRTHAGCRNRSALCRGHIATAPAHDNLSGECAMRLSCDRDQRRRA